MKREIEKSSLLSCNDLEQNADGIWLAEQHGPFEYSDGETSERYLREVVSAMDDVTSLSTELEKKAIDWASEYHLSPERANILRALNLDGVRVALELGCGCGAITRYLGESNIEVDAVEGNINRAEIARLRCRDLSGVHVINANFNDLVFPKKSYDAVFLIGVLEYAKRFCPNAVSDTDAVAKILSKIQPTLTEQGVIVIAIENRMGLKYWMGASEDHYAQPYIGLYGYPQDKDVATYDRRQWVNMLQRAGFKHYRFVYPFPDYKVAKIVLSEAYVRNDAFAHSILYRICSRDYEKDWEPGSEEFLLWRSLHQNGYLEEFVNSFIIIVSDAPHRLQEMVPFDFMHFSDNRRKHAYRTVTLKPAEAPWVVKKQIWPKGNDTQKCFIQQTLKTINYIRGPLLSSIWLDNLFGNEKISNFESLIHTYYDFLVRSFKRGENGRYHLDLLPFNIIVDDNGDYQIIDDEWKTFIRITPDFILFRALLLLSFYHHKLIRRICRIYQFPNVRAFILHFFTLLSVPLEKEIDRFIELEERIQKEIILQMGSGDIGNYLMHPFEQTETEERPSDVFVQLFWARSKEAFSEENSLIVRPKISDERQVIEFRMPLSAKAIHRLRLDPMNCEGPFHIDRFTIKQYMPNDSVTKVLWDLCSAEEIFNRSRKTDVRLSGKISEATFLSTSDDPQMIFELPDAIIPGRKHGEIRIEAEMGWKR